MRWTVPVLVAALLWPFPGWPAAGSDLYVVDAAGDTNAVVRLTWKTGWSHAGTVLRSRNAASVAVSSTWQAYYVTGLDGNVVFTDGRTDHVAYRHPGQIREVAFGRSSDVLYFSELATPVAGSGLPSGKIFALNLATSTARLLHTIDQDAVGGSWWGRMTVDEDDRIYLATMGPPGQLFDLRDGSPMLLHRVESERILGLGHDGNHLNFTTGSSMIHQLRGPGTVRVVADVPNGRFQHLTFAPFYLGGQQASPCDLRVDIRGDPQGLFFPIVNGPNLIWQSVDPAHGGRVGPGQFRYSVLPGTYWVRTDTRGDIGRAPRPREHRIDCRSGQVRVRFELD